MVKTIKAVLNFSIRGKKNKEEKKRVKIRERVWEGGKVLSLQATTVEEVPGTSCLPPKTAPIYQSSKHKPQLLARTRQSPHAVASLSHTTVEQSWWHRAQNNLLRHTAQGGKNRSSQQCWGRCADGAEYLPPAHTRTHMHACKQGSCTR